MSGPGMRPLASAASEEHGDRVAGTVCLAVYASTLALVVACAVDARTTTRIFEPQHLCPKLVSLAATYTASRTVWQALLVATPDEPAGTPRLGADVVAVLLDATAAISFYAGFGIALRRCTARAACDAPCRARHASTRASPRR